MEVKQIVGLVISMVMLVVSAVVGVLFFGVVAFAIVGIIALFVLLSFLVYLNRRWKNIVAWFRGRFDKNKDIKKKRGRWESNEEVVVAEIEEK
jgi:hypothetical protein